MSWLVDTNILSELRKGVRGDRAVSAWFQSVDDGDVFTSVLVVGEIRRGIESIRRRDARSANVLDAWLEGLVANFGARILFVDHAVAIEWGRMNVPDRLPTVDGLLAATARVRGLTLVTRNTRDVAKTGVRCLNPFSPSSKA
jgi:predicted nucleic acid-binding protein